MNTVSSILKHVHKGTIETAYTILNGEFEVIEAEIIFSSELINKELKILIYLRILDWCYFKKKR